jgi:ribosomal protein L24E
MRLYWKKRSKTYREQDNKKTEQIPIKTEPKKTLAWTKERDQILLDNFDELRISGIYDQHLLPGFSLSEIRHRCQELHLIDSFGNTIEDRRGGRGDK